MTLTKDRIFEADDRPRRLVEVVEWGGDLYMATLSAFSKEKWEEAVSKDELAYGHIRAALIQLCAEDAAGALLFDAADIPALSDKAAIVLDRLFTIAREMNGLTDDDIEEMEKNSKSGPPADSRSDSA